MKLKWSIKEFRWFPDKGELQVDRTDGNSFEKRILVVGTRHTIEFFYRTYDRTHDDLWGWVFYPGDACPDRYKKIKLFMVDKI